ncbi:Uncharacterized protein TCAP_03451 [Tolypocladium capitatum]|uniref:Uncharacterized protein n=1 Tax=Tolypocladium capitatum TaxID=45235 RepID=A0A2K3QGE1_9HYPO|nr:Uncharacterized protein TCAP_03451 [Tolypocladium capitatum]
MEANRLWHDPVVEIYGNLITPGVRCSANAYDLGNRRWYQLNVDSPVTDDEWLSNVVAKHVAEHYRANRAPPPWDTINTTTGGDSVSFEARPSSRVDRPITEVLKYGLQPGHKLPTTHGRHGPA